jgi:hypothetical protein
MATVQSALEDVRQEVETLILGLTPNRMVKARATFKLHKNNVKKNITEMTGSSRLFYVGEPDSQNIPYSVGHSTIHDIVNMPITFVYATGQAWRVAALDDMRQIEKQLRITASTAAGVAHRSVMPGTQNQQFPTPIADGWEYHQLILTVYLSV